MAQSRSPPQSRRCSTARALPNGLAFDHPIADVRREANDSGFVRGNVGPIKVDLFFPETLARHGREPIDREFVGKHVREILHPDDAEPRLEVLGRCLDNETDASRAGRSPR